MEDDRLQGILFNADDTIKFADASTISKRMLIKTRRAAKRVSNLKDQYHLPLPEVRLHPRQYNKLQPRQVIDVATRLKVQ